MISRFETLSGTDERNRPRNMSTIEFTHWLTDLNPHNFIKENIIRTVKMNIRLICNCLQYWIIFTLFRDFSNKSWTNSSSANISKIQETHLLPHLWTPNLIILFCQTYIHSSKSIMLNLIILCECYNFLIRLTGI